MENTKKKSPGFKSVALFHIGKKRDSVACLRERTFLIRVF